MSAQLPRANVRMSPRLSGNPSHHRATTAKAHHHHHDPPPAGSGSGGTKSKSSGREKRRFREAKQRTTAAYFASEEGSSGEDVVLRKGTSLQSQPHQQQMKYLNVNVDQSGGSCLSSDNGGGSENALNPNRLHLQLRKFACGGGGAQKGTKSPSDLEADEEDNQEYDSTSMVSQSEMNLQRLAAADGDNGSSTSTAAPPAVSNESKEFQSHLQQIRRAGMRDLAGRGAASSSDDDDEELGKLLEKERRDKVALMQQLSDQESRISSLEKVVSELTKKLQDVELDRQRLHRENLVLRKS